MWVGAACLGPAGVERAICQAGLWFSLPSAGSREHCQATPLVGGAPHRNPFHGGRRPPTNPVGMELRKTVFTGSPASSNNGCSSLNDGWVSLLRRIPPGTRGKARLARLLMNRRLNGSPVLLRDKWGFRYEAPDARESIAFHLTIDGVYEPETMALISRQL